MIKMFKKKICIYLTNFEHDHLPRFLGHHRLVYKEGRVCISYNTWCFLDLLHILDIFVCSCCFRVSPKSNGEDLCSNDRKGGTHQVDSYFLIALVDLWEAFPENDMH